MKQYFVKLSTDYVPKNALQRAVSDLRLRWEQTLVTEPFELLKEIAVEVANLNRLHSKCTPMEVTYTGEESEYYYENVRQKYARISVKTQNKRDGFTLFSYLLYVVNEQKGGNDGCLL